MRNDKTVGRRHRTHQPHATERLSAFERSGDPGHANVEDRLNCEVCPSADTAPYTRSIVGLNQIKEAVLTSVRHLSGYG